MIKRYTAPLGAFVVLASLTAAPLAALAEDAEMKILFPVDGDASFRNDFHEPRGADGQREHFGIDIIAPKMTPIVAAADGTITSLVNPEASWGYSITLRDEDGFQYRYLHINNDTPGTDDGDGGTEYAYAPGIKRGTKVEKGDLIAWVGDSGNAEGTVSHLHFEIRDDNRSRTALNPYNVLVEAAEESDHDIKTGAAPVTTHPSDGNIGVEVDPTAPLTENLSEGSTGTQVRLLQTKLKALGFFTSTVTEYFGPITKTAVIKFQTANKITADGIVGTKTRAALNGEDIDEDATLPPGDLPPVNMRYLFTQTLNIGSRGEEVRQLQLKLTTLGHFTAEATSYFGSLTQAAVISFQKAKGIDPIGIVGPMTRAALNTQ